MNVNHIIVVGPINLSAFGPLHFGIKHALSGCYGFDSMGFDNSGFFRNNHFKLSRG